MSFDPVSFSALRQRIAAGAVTPRQALQEARARIEARDAGIGAFVRLAPHPQASAQGPLSGIAVGVKDVFDTRDMETEHGSPVFAGHRPRTDAAVVSMLRAAGATIIGKTVTTEFAFLNPAATRNPANPAHTPGGSSSGSAAAVAAGMVPAAIGTQTGGSVIRPASYCGIAGYKPSFRLVPTVGLKTFSWSLDTVGFFAATVPDVAAFAAAVTGRALDGGPAPARLRVGLFRSALWAHVEPAMRDAFSAAEARLASGGVVLSEVGEPEAVTAGRDAHATIQNFEAGLALADEWLHHRAALSPVLRNTLDAGRAISPDAFDSARRDARRARIAAKALFDGVDVLLTVSASGPAPAGLGSTGDPRHNKLWTLLGLPVVNVPGLRDASGLPLGLSVIAPFGGDSLALSAAAIVGSLIRPEG